jgi:HTH-type transcriptional regulator/antitoxin HigA
MTTNEEGERMAGFVPAEVFPPGATILAELEELGWTQTDLAEVMDRPLKTISGLVNGKVRVTEDTAKELELALGIDADFWLRSEAYYRLHTSQTQTSKAIAKRAAIRQRVPLRQMVLRGWITLTDDPDELKRRIEAFLGGPIDKPVAFTMAAKQSSYTEPLSAEQEVWLLRAKQLAGTMQLLPYSKAALLEAVERMHELLRSPDDAYRVPKLLADAGVRFVIVERLPGLRIDGVCFWLGDKQPVIAMSMIRDRIDNFWFVLRHEIEHVLNGDGKDGAFMVDNDLDEAPSVSGQERRANAAASEFCVPQAELEEFMKRKGGLFTDRNIRQFAHSQGLHSGLVAGQLRKRLSQGPLGKEAWRRFLSHLAKIRHVVINTALVDGFGSSPQLA